MQLVEQYLHEVGRHLPDDMRDDILSELRSSIEEEILELGAQESSDEEQQAAVIERYGHPVKVAAAYRPPQYLIGPELYPAFIQTLQTVLTVSVIAIICLHMLSWVVRDSGTSIAHLLSNATSLFIWAGGIVVISFVVLEQCGERLDWYENWRAATLKSSHSIDRTDLMTNLVTEGVFLLWWNSAISFKQWIPYFEEKFTVSFLPVWETLFWPINAIAIAWFVLHAFVLLRDRWNRSTLWLELLLNLTAITVIIGLLTQAGLIAYTGSVEQFDILQRSLRITLVVIAGLIAWDTYLALKRLRAY